jgi:transposase
LHVVQIAKELKVSYSLLRKFIKKQKKEKSKRKKELGHQPSQEIP